MSKLLDKHFIKQFVSYFCVGGVSALIEWGTFSFIEFFLDIPYLLATAISFVVSTTANWFLGRKFTFKNSSYKNKICKEILLVFAVSAIGLILNMVLMYVFVDVFLLNSSVLLFFDKIIATGIVFIWNFLVRKLFVYKSVK